MSGFRVSGGVRRKGQQLSAAEAKAKLLRAIEAVDDALLADYPRGEVESFPTQLAEAAAFLGLTEGELLAGVAGTPGDIALCPHVTGICAAEHGAATSQQRLVQVTAKVAAIRAQAIAWSQVRAALTGLRSRAFGDIEEAEDSAGIQAALQTALAEIAGAGLGGHS